MAHGFSGEPAAHPATLPVHDPARGDVIDELPVDDAAAVEVVVARARAAQPAWAAMPARERGRRCAARGASWSGARARDPRAPGARDRQGALRRRR